MGMSRQKKKIVSGVLQVSWIINPGVTAQNNYSGCPNEKMTTNCFPFWVKQYQTVGLIKVGVLKYLENNTINWVSGGKNQLIWVS